MPNITDNVSFDTVAREWRCKWDVSDDKKSLSECQSILDAALSELKAVPGVKSVQRVVCGGCQDFKVITALDASSFGAWEANGFAPEGDFLAKLKEVGGVLRVETQTYTLMTM